ncbi:hypothetical protein MAFF241647_49680 (plasmid) [Ralstonia solanacearum]|nr:hypothetical protein MAFF241647_49680 [Ralstonia solanacearum]
MNGPLPSWSRKARRASTVSGCSSHACAQTAKGSRGDDGVGAPMFTCLVGRNRRGKDLPPSWPCAVSPAPLRREKPTSPASTAAGLLRAGRAPGDGGDIAEG